MKSILKYFTVVLGMSLMVSCNDLLDINQDPDEASLGNPPQVLTSAQGFMTWIIGERLPERSNLWAQYWTWGPGVQLGNAERFIMEPDDNNNVWFRAYVNVLPDLKYLNETGNPVYGGIAKTLEAYLYSTLVDYFGDIPYSEAIQGDDNLSPSFDDDALVYADLIIKLDAALAEFASLVGTEEGPGDSDLMFGGDISLWTKFANSLKLKLLLRQSLVSDVGGEVQTLIANGTFIESESDMAMVEFVGTSGDQNPQYASFESGVGQFYIASSTIMDRLLATQDPRTFAFFDVPANTDDDDTLSLDLHASILQGSIELEPFSNTQDFYSSPSGTNFDRALPRPEVIDSSANLVYGKDRPVIFMSHWEVWFLRAEAAARYGTADGEFAAFESGVRESINYCLNNSSYSSVGSGQVAAYLNSLNYPDGGSLNARLRAIAIEKWVSFCGLQATEAWTEVRRFDTPENPIFTGMDEGIFTTPESSTLPAGTFPTIYLIPADERSFNPNAPQQQMITDQVFWDN